MEWMTEMDPVAWILDYQLVFLILVYEPRYTGLGLEPHWLAQDSQDLAMVDSAEFPFVGSIGSLSQLRLELACHGF